MPTIVDVAAQHEALGMIAAELMRACALHPPYNSPHEAYAVALEELDEFWDEVRKKNSERDLVRMRDELIQVGAVAVRALVDLGLVGAPRVAVSPTADADAAPEGVSPDGDQVHSH